MELGSGVAAGVAVGLEDAVVLPTGVFCMLGVGADAGVVQAQHSNMKLKNKSEKRFMAKGLFTQKH